MNDSKLWFEKYRPDNVKDYVWTDSNQKLQVETWIRDKSIPHLLISGSPGTGKCLGADEVITIRVNRSKLTVQQLAYLDNLRKLTGQDSSYLVDPSVDQLDITMLDLFTMLGLEFADYEHAHDISDVGISVKTPTGWQPVLALVRKNTATARYTLDNNSELTCATKHLVFEYGKCKTINTCASIDTLDGPANIIGSEFLGDRDLYDLSIPAPHVYVTANGILHHNTTLAKVLLKEIGVEDSDIRYVNGSHTNGVDDMRDLENFAETMPSGEFRYVLLDESDYLSPNAQAVLRNMIETYDRVCRWILTCNYPSKVIPALHSRTQGFHIDRLDKEQFATRAATILIAENIPLDEESLEILDEYITVTYPDLRKCINSLQQNTRSGTLTRPGRGGSKTSNDYLVQAVALFKEGRISEARKLICARAVPEEYEDIYKMLYQNLEWWGEKPEQQDQAVVIIANRLKDHTLCADSEINLSACLIELSLLNK